jgi:hypothetical protein
LGRSRNIEGTNWKPMGEEIGPYASADEAEIAAINSSWFKGGK